MMKRLYRTLLVLITLSSMLPAAYAATPYHVTDEVKIFMHTGPSNQYRIKAQPTSGTELTLLGKDNNTGYVHVRTDKGTEGWIDGKYLDKGHGIAFRLPTLEKELSETKTALQEQKDKVASLTEQLANLDNQRRTELSNVNEARAQSTAAVAQLENEINRLQNQIDGMDETNLMGWFIRGGGVVLLGIIIGLIIPSLPKKRRRTDDWF